MQIYKLWELPSPCTVVVGENAFAFTSMDELVKAFNTVESDRMLPIIEQSNFVEQEDGAFKLLSYTYRK